MCGGGCRSDGKKRRRRVQQQQQEAAAATRSAAAVGAEAVTRSGSGDKKRRQEAAAATRSGPSSARQRRPDWIGAMESEQHGRDGEVAEEATKIALGPGGTAKSISDPRSTDPKDGQPWDERIRASAVKQVVVRCSNTSEGHELMWAS
ncbi:hypothetical protein QQ045_029172 [Rhodiola kirilowii]